MARNRFGGDQIGVGEADGVDGVDDLAQMLGADGLGTVTVWNEQTGGTQYTDLLDTTGAAVDHSTLSTGADGYSLGTIVPFDGPDEIWELWASVNGGPRFKMVATNTGTRLGPLATATASALTAHVAATEAANPHVTRVRDLTDVNATAAAAATDGQVLTFQTSSGLWLPTTVAGVGDAVRLTTTQTITGLKTFSPPSAGSNAVRYQALAGQTGDVWAGFSEGGNRTGYANEKGELRARAAAANSVAFRTQGFTGQTANIFEITDVDNNALIWGDPSGRMRARNINSLPPFFVTGALTVGTGQATWYNDFTAALTIIAVRISVGVAPTGADVIVDVNVAGTTIFSGAKPTITAGTTTSGKITAIGTPTIAIGAALTVDVDQIGSTLPGEKLTVQILAY